MSSRVVGTRARPPDWDARTSGVAAYVGDVQLDGMLEASVVRSPHPHAEIRSIDTRRARGAPGVRAVITAADFPTGARYKHSGEEGSDRPPLAEGVVRYIGQEVAAVAAETRAEADAAARRVRVRYRRRRAPVTVAQALAPGAARLHERSAGANLAASVEGTWGDPSAGWRAAVHRTEGSYYWPRQAQAPMEPQAIIAHWDPDDQVLHLWPSTQSPYFVASEVALLLGIELAQVHCHDVAVGGGFGGKSKVGEHELLAARLSQLSGRPVRLVYGRHEEFSVTKNRHPFRTRMRSGADAAGRLVVLDGSIEVENGAYTHYGAAVMRVGVKALGSIYRPLGVRWDAHLVDTATQPGGSFRGYGTSQVVFAIEQQVDELAELAGVDPLEWRRRNANEPDTTTLNGSRLGSARLVECLDAVRTGIDWDAKRSAGVPWRGVGVAAGSHGSGSYAFADSNRSEAAVRLGTDGSILVRFASGDAGTGQRTILGQMAADVLGVTADDVDVEMMATDLHDQGAWSSRGTHMGGHAVRVASEAAADRLLALAAQKLGSGEIRLEGGWARSATAEVSIGDLVGLDPDTVDDRLEVVGEWLDPRMERYDPSNPAPNVAASYTFAAHAVEVEVDPVTGRVHVLDYVAAHDIGRAINPTQTESQIIGGAVMGLGAALGEEVRYEVGRVVNPAFVHYALPRSGDVPTVRTVLVEGPEEAGPFDAKSVGEMSLIPAAPAIANAVYDAIGIRFRELPITPDKVLAALAERDGRRRRTPWWRSPVAGWPARWWVDALRRLYPLGLHTVLHRYGTRMARRWPPRAVVDVVAPVDLDDAVRRLDRDSAVIGGGTDVAAQRQQGLTSPVRLVSTRDIEGMRRLELDDPTALVIGGAVTLRELAEAARHRVPVLTEVVETIASAQLRATATVAGNLLQAKRCWFFRNGFDCYKRGGATCPCYAVTGDHRFGHAVIGGHRCQAVTPSDLATVLVALDAAVEVRGPDGDRTIAVSDLYSGPGESVLGERDVLVSVHLPASAVERRGAFEKLALYDGDFAVASAVVTAMVGDDGLRDARVVLGAVAPVPWRAERAERALNGSGSRGFPAAVDAELDRHAHPLPGNAWKLDAVSGLAVRAADRLLDA